MALLGGTLDALPGLKYIQKTHNFNEVEEFLVPTILAIYENRLLTSWREETAI